MRWRELKPMSLCASRYLPFKRCLHGSISCPSWLRVEGMGCHWNECLVGPVPLVIGPGIGISTWWGRVVVGSASDVYKDKSSSYSWQKLLMELAVLVERWGISLCHPRTLHCEYCFSKANGKISPGAKSEAVADSDLRVDSCFGAGKALRAKECSSSSF